MVVYVSTPDRGVSASGSGSRAHTDRPVRRTPHLSFLFFLPLLLLPEARTAPPAMPLSQAKVAAPALEVVRITAPAGQIVVRGIDGPRVRLQGSPPPEGFEEEPYRLRSDGAETTIEVLVPAARGAEYRLSVEVPREVHLEVNLSAGRIEVAGMEGSVRLESDRAHLMATRITGRVEASSVNGDIDLRETSGGVQANTISGHIRLHRVPGEVRATCISGNITISGEGAFDVSASSTGGNIRFEGPLVAGGRYLLSSHSGDITFLAAEGPGYEALLSTFSGSITTPLDFTLIGPRISRRSLRGTWGEPSARVELTAFSGSIALLVP